MKAMRNDARARPVRRRRRLPPARAWPNHCVPPAKSERSAEQHGGESGLCRSAAQHAAQHAQACSDDDQGRGDRTRAPRQRAQRQRGMQRRPDVRRRREGQPHRERCREQQEQIAARERVRVRAWRYLRAKAMARTWAQRPGVRQSAPDNRPAPQLPVRSPAATGQRGCAGTPARAARRQDSPMARPAVAGIRSRCAAILFTWRAVPRARVFRPIVQSSRACAMRATCSRGARLGPLRGNNFIVSVMRSHRKAPCHKSLQLTVTGSRRKNCDGVPTHMRNRPSCN
jgi:hypothetical protein